MAISKSGTNFSKAHRFWGQAFVDLGVYSQNHQHSCGPGSIVIHLDPIRLVQFWFAPEVDIYIYIYKVMETNMLSRENLSSNFRKKNVPFAIFQDFRRAFLKKNIMDMELMLGLRNIGGTGCINVTQRDSCGAWRVCRSLPLDAAKITSPIPFWEPKFYCFYTPENDSHG